MIRKLATIWLPLLASCGSEPIPGTAEFEVRIEYACTDLDFGKAVRFEVVRTWRKTLVPEPFENTAWSPLVVKRIATRRTEDDARIQETIVCDGYAFTRDPIQIAPLLFRARPRDGSALRTVEVAPPRLRMAPVSRETSVPQSLAPQSGAPQSGAPQSGAPQSQPASAPELPREFFDPPPAWERPVLIATLALGGAVWLWLGWNRKRTRRRELSPADLEALTLQRLEALRTRTPEDRADRQALYLEVTELVRTALRVPPEWTTEELLASREPHTREVLATFLIHCDLVKFADHSSSAAEREAMFAAAERLVRE